MKAAPPLKRQNIQLAATLVLVRDSARGLEVYMTRRPGGIDFANLHVFPGGKVAVADDSWLAQGFAPAGVEAAQVDELLGERNALRYWLAAVRESFEECGVLYARRPGGSWLNIGTQEQPHFASLRQQLIDGELTLEGLCQEHGLQLDLGALAYFSHWLTPEVAPRRFDTRFFLARMLPQQQTLPHQSEVVSGHWVCPQDALDRAASRQWQLIAPTLITLESLARYADVDSLWTAVARREHLPPLTAALRAEGMVG